MNRVPFEYFEHLPTVPVTIAGQKRRFVLDTGIGLTILSSALAASIGCHRDGRTYTGRRMSGQDVDVPLASLAELEFGGHVRRDLTVGIFDIGDIDGFLSVGFFDTVPVTFDSGAICVTGAPSVRQEDPETMFQTIIYDGLIGDSFLKNFAVTYDLQHDRMVFS